MDPNVVFPQEKVNRRSLNYLHVNNCGFQTRTDSFTVTRSDGWQDYHFLLIRSGECVAWHNGEKYWMFPGNLLFYAPGEPQQYTFPQECQSLWLHFSGTAVEEILTSCHFTSGVYPFQPDNTILELFSTLIKRFNRVGEQQSTNAALIELIAHLAERAEHPEASRCPDGIQRVTSHITRNYGSRFTLDELAALSGYSKSRFSYLFRKFIGQTPLEYLRNIRLNSSCDLLCSTQLSISEIAFSCGYDDVLYFSRIFRKRYGIPPTEYKKRFS